ncbi:hypothetical protein DB346_02465 [Verrucomicrobia bacterium LW23]|nr:hypothetical protein DB346_04190 [Verrucomicrobia bacterium LW23]PTY04313.1 hypothetical protein DB346_02465 [Verrucomicrobia bacterium LW23]
MTHPPRETRFVRPLRRALACFVLFAAIFGGVVQAHAARDWFVKANSGDDADGTILRPYKDIYWALEQAKEGDYIHVAEGTYTGRLDTANWTLDTPRLRILGGYNGTFTERAPWKYVTRFAFQAGSRARNTGTMLIGGRDHSGCIIDGIVFDQQNRNTYASADPRASLEVQRSSRDPIISLTSPEVEIRNCLIINGSGTGVILAGEGSRFENNVVMNMAGPHLLELRGNSQEKPTVISGNSFMFCWSAQYGRGDDPGAGLKLWGGTRAEITGNLFLMCDGAAIEVHTSADRVSLKDNLFCLSGLAHVRFASDGRQALIDTGNFNDINDLGFKLCENNRVGDPELLEVDRGWMEYAINRAADVVSKVKPEEWARFRQALGLNAPTEGKGPQGFAMAYDALQALKMVLKGQAAGSKSATYPVQFAGPLVKSYWTVPYSTFLIRAQSLNNRDVALFGIVGREVKGFTFAGVAEKDYRAFELIPSPLGPVENPPLVFIRRGAPTEALLDKTLALQPPPSNAAREFYFKGVCKWDGGASVPHKGALVLEELVVPAQATPTGGRDWFVRSGSQGGDGSREKPFGDPQEAIELALPGDVVHVAAGEYARPGTRGGWRVDVPFVTLRGGYNSEFTERIPWRFASRLSVAAGPLAGAIVRGEEDHTGTIIDGFVLDGRDMNVYDGQGNLVPGRSPRKALLSLSSGGCMIRNCLILNGSLGSVEISGGSADAGVMENCVLLNFSWQSVQLSPADDTMRTFVLRQCTVLASWYDRPGGPGGTPDGAGVATRGDVSLELDGNIIGYHDSVGVYCSSPPGRVRLVNNLFCRNLFGNYTDAQRTFLDDNMAQVAYAGFASASGNFVGDPPLPWDKDWLTLWTSRAQRLGRRWPEDDWRRFREAAGLKSEDVSAAAASGDPVYARAYDWRKALPFFMAPAEGAPGGGPGARAVPLPVHFLGIPGEALSTKAYAPAEVGALQSAADTIDARNVALTGVLGDMLPQIPADLIEETKVGDWTGVELFATTSARGETPMLVVVKRDTRMARRLKVADRALRYVLRGTARKSSRLGRAVLVLETLEREATAPATPAPSSAPAPVAAPAASAPPAPAPAPAPVAPATNAAAPAPASSPAPGPTSAPAPAPAAGAPAAAVPAAVPATNSPRSPPPSGGSATPQPTAQPTPQPAAGEGRGQTSASPATAPPAPKATNAAPEAKPSAAKTPPAAQTGGAPSVAAPETPGNAPAPPPAAPAPAPAPAPPAPSATNAPPQASSAPAPAPPTLRPQESAPAPRQVSPAPEAAPGSAPSEPVLVNPGATG